MRETGKEVKMPAKRYYLAAALTDLAAGVLGFVLFSVAFLLALGLKGGTGQGYGALCFFMGIAVLLVFIIIYFSNKMIFFYFNQFNKIPVKHMFFSNLAAWGIIVILYLIMSLL